MHLAPESTGRTQAGRVLFRTRSGLIEQLGGAPSVAELLLIESASLKACRLFLLSEKLLGHGDQIVASLDEKSLAILNSMRLDLMALGLQQRIRDVTPSLASILGECAEQASSATPGNGNGHYCGDPEDEEDEHPNEKRRRLWTPERRAAQAERMKRRFATEPSAPHKHDEAAP